MQNRFLTTKCTKDTKCCNFKPLPSFVKRVPPQRRVFFSVAPTNPVYLLGSPFGRAVGVNAD
ncbi:MAG: hypothetical protein FWH14_04615 [Oscillospiraceae bacterium]|nr:hypothetical protein [Oscillospiraceae bacterium]